jgi:hypothetical protein
VSQSHALSVLWPALGRPPQPKPPQMMAQTARTMRPQWNDDLDETPVGRGTVPPPSAPSTGALTHLTSHSSQALLALAYDVMMMRGCRACAHLVPPAL